MKKILFAAVSLDVGGIETALVSLINYLAKIKENNEFKYDITLVLERKQGIFLDSIDERIKLMEYKPNGCKVTLIRKCMNLFKQLSFKRKYGNKYDFSVSYATYSLPDSFVARTASKNSALWCHMDYLGQYHGNKELVKQFFEEKKYNEFKKIVFVSEKSKETFLEVFPDMKGKTYWINNIINYKDIIEKTKMPIEPNDQELLNKKGIKNCTIFLNVGRHDELQKKLSRIIDAAKKLKQDGERFKIIFVGDGQDNLKYKKMVKESNLKNEIIFMGKKKNPYPFFNIADCLLLSSDYEGSPVVFTETMLLNKPIITTDVAGSNQIKGKYGVIAEMNSKDIYEKMKQFMKYGYNIANRFDPIQYNEDIIEKISKII